ncbi:MAG: hypothetical protein JXJ17_00300 [Anaerolineae bacterium]|nr:hypothetical protein [Anaerolineae bacterium]
MSDKEPSNPSDHKNWILRVSLALLVITIAGVVFVWFQPCTMPPSYYANSYFDPVNYSELISNHTMRNCNFVRLFAIIIPIASILLLILSEARRRMVVIATLVSCIMACGLGVITFFSLWADGAELAEVGSVEFDGHRYHLTQADVVAGGMDVYYTDFFLHECDLDDQNCYGRELSEDVFPAFSDPSLLLNEEANQLEVWDEDELILALSASTVPLPEGFGDLPEIDAENADSLGEIVRLGSDSMWSLEWSTDGTTLTGNHGNRSWLFSYSPAVVSTSIRYLANDEVVHRGYSPLGENVTPDGKYHLYLEQVPGQIEEDEDNTDTMLYVWNIEGLAVQCEIAFPDDTGRVSAMSISPDGSLVATGTNDGQVFLWVVETGEMVAQFQAHEDNERRYYSTLTAVAFSPDGHILATSGGDNTVRLWGVVQ